MRTILLLSLALSAGLALAATVRSDHPIVGTWTHTLPNGCSEVYTFRTDGTDHVTSGEEVSDGSYEISDTPDGRGVYVLVEKVGRNNGKPDCTGSSAPAGDVATVYVKFSTTGNSMMVCYDAALEACFTMERVRPV